MNKRLYLVFAIALAFAAAVGLQSCGGPGKVVGQVMFYGAGS